MMKADIRWLDNPEIFRVNREDAHSDHAYYASYILADWRGAVSEEKAPFSADSNQALRTMIQSMASKPDTLRTDAEVHLKNMDFYDPSDISGIKEAIMEHGSVDVSVYYDTSNMYHSSTVTSAYESSHDSEDANHCVTVIGWDDNFNTFSKSTPSSGAWLIANSYGENYNYSTNGYYWLSYYDSSLCEICTLEAESTDKYDTNFQYDGVGWGDLYQDTENIGFSNIFTNGTDSPRRIGAAGFYTLSDNQPYKIEIYRQLTGSAPNSGTRIDKCTTYGTVEHSGYHTISLANSVAIAAGERFSVVVTFYAENGNTVYVPIEGSSDPLGSKYNSKSGQSYVYSEGKWMDNTSIKLGASHRNMNNVCLKALASTISDTEYEQQQQNANKQIVGAAWENKWNLAFTDALGKNLVRRTVVKHFKAVIERANIPSDVRFHDLRHSFAVTSLYSGDDVKTVQANLGHATAQFTLDVYGHVTQKMRQESAMRMQAFYNHLEV